MCRHSPLGAELPLPSQNTNMYTACERFHKPDAEGAGHGVRAVGTGKAGVPLEQGGVARHAGHGFGATG